MSSAPRSKPLPVYRIQIAAWYAGIFIVTTVGLFLLFEHMLDAHVEEEWDVTIRSIHSAWGRDQGLGEGEVHAAITRIHAAGTVVTAPDTDRLMRQEFLILTLPMLLLAVGGGMWLTSRAVRPLRRLNTVVHGILETGDFSARVHVGKAQGELRVLVDVFNRMLGRMEKLISSMQGALDNVAHDLRTPMTRCRMVAERALEHPEDTEATREALADSLEEGDQVLRMLTTLMEVAEAESGAMRLTKEDVVLSEIAANVVDLYEFVAEDKQITLEVDVPESLTVFADPGRLRQGLANLVDNAIKYGNPGGHVLISAEAGEGCVILGVKDDGIGLAPKDLPHIWDRLYRADRSRGEHGLGLGLSFVRALVEAHGGTVSVESELDKGTAFVVRLPV